MTDSPGLRVRLEEKSEARASLFSGKCPHDYSEPDDGDISIATVRHGHSAEYAARWNRADADYFRQRPTRIPGGSEQQRKDLCAAFVETLHTVSGQVRPHVSSVDTDIIPRRRILRPETEVVDVAYEQSQRPATALACRKGLANGAGLHIGVHSADATIVTKERNIRRVENRSNPYC